MGAVDFDVPRAGDPAGRSRDDRVVATVDGYDFRLRAQRAAKILRERATAMRNVAFGIEKAAGTSAFRNP